MMVIAPKHVGAVLTFSVQHLNASKSPAGRSFLGI